MQAERIRFILTDYVRIRIEKIERFAEHILAEERARPESEAPHLTAEEFLFAKAYTSSIKEYLRNVILNRLPANMQTVKDEDLALQPTSFCESIAFHPCEHSYVLCRVLSRIDSVQVSDYTNSESQSSITSLTLEPEEQHLLPFSSIQRHVENGDVILI
ncbi:DNA replication complex GINS protein SLD5 [Fasciola gigantica]|uniref:DNA replication complex GINS protein SLD5 n=1 Tax=Fasciola gigantica TaxID=46835 RepID=A0A504Y9Q7_FASGI|nr:DNA replication complex GINS protein SLD5 [Fasciola gigantica]